MLYELYNNIYTYIKQYCDSSGKIQSLLNGIIAFKMQ